MINIFCWVVLIEEGSAVMTVLMILVYMDILFTVGKRGATGLEGTSTKWFVSRTMGGSRCAIISRISVKGV